MSGLEYNAGSDLIPEERIMDSSEFKGSSGALLKLPGAGWTSVCFGFHPLLPTDGPEKEKAILER